MGSCLFTFLFTFLQVCEKQIPGGENGLHGPNKVTEKEDIDPPFLMSAVKADAGFVLGTKKRTNLIILDDYSKFRDSTLSTRKTLTIHLKGEN